MSVIVVLHIYIYFSLVVLLTWSRPLITIPTTESAVDNMYINNIITVLSTYVNVIEGNSDDTR